MQSSVWWEGSKCTYLLCCSAGGLDGGLGESDLNRGQMWRQWVGDALHDVAHLGTAVDGYCDVLGHLWWHFGDLLQHHWRWAGWVGPSSFARLLILIRAADTLKEVKEFTSRKLYSLDGFERNMISLENPKNLNCLFFPLSHYVKIRFLYTFTPENFCWVYSKINLKLTSNAPYRSNRGMTLKITIPFLLWKWNGDWSLEWMEWCLSLTSVHFDRNARSTRTSLLPKH